MCIVFLQLCCVRLVGIMLLVYIKENYWSHTTDVEVDTVKTGAGGIMVGVVKSLLVWSNLFKDRSV